MARRTDRLAPLIDEALMRSVTAVRDKVGVLYKDGPCALH